jgi:hypothetical protein
VQRRELADARTEDNYTVREWVDFPGATYVEHDGEAEILPGVRLLPAPGHTAGHQIVVVETDEGPVVLGGDVGHWFEELEDGETPGAQLVLGTRGADLPRACRGGACPAPGVVASSSRPKAVPSARRAPCLAEGSSARPRTMQKPCSSMRFRRSRS